MTTFFCVFLGNFLVYICNNKKLFKKVTRKCSIYTPKDIIVCPYDKNHVLLWFRLERHIWKCHRADKEKQRASSKVMVQEEEENWDHFNEPSYLDCLRTKKNHNALN
ncbi:hypothetical protein TcasGA2_TC030945 [Tribolium castaneum]|uniref:CHHC U11-48K-type domain-containing protein n=1 Tax=Tribolium castaneum TaxID=7070 RepID=A0A139W933_TRICA|nr:hypothetical protein TcasGA2_TC030945 [Tribolium castaneum]